MLFTRRSFLAHSASVLGLLSAGNAAHILGEPLWLSMYNRHTGEALKKVIFWENGLFLPDAVQALSHFFRDHRTGGVKIIDGDLFILLAHLQKTLGAREIHLISGYRSPKTNTQLATRSGGVARDSQHLYGKAADIFVPGVSLQKVKKVALNLKRGGVGGYRHFVHVDTGRLRQW